MSSEKEPSPTAGMSIEQRILHVGGRNNQAGYVEFGSAQAVQAMISQILRDLPNEQLAPSGQVFGIIDQEYGRILTIARPAGLELWLFHLRPRIIYARSGSTDGAVD